MNRYLWTQRTGLKDCTCHFSNTIIWCCTYHFSSAIILSHYTSTHTSTVSRWHLEHPPNDKYTSSSIYDYLLNSFSKLPQPRKKGLMICTHTYNCCTNPSPSHTITVWALGNWLTFTTSGSILQSQDYNLQSFLFLFCKFLAKIQPNHYMICLMTIVKIIIRSGPT